MSTLTQSTQTINDIKSIPLESLFIEASAGTGKTYTIIRLFFRYILEKKVDFRKILLVTFTKKATEEMLNRIHELASDLILKKNFDFLNLKSFNNSEIQILEDLLKNFDQINVSTIHSFCRGILKDYPFELNLPSNVEILNSEKPILEKIFFDFIFDYENNKKNYNLDNFFQKSSVGKLNLYLQRFISESQSRTDFILNFLDLGNYKFSEIKEEKISKSFLVDEKIKDLLKFFRYVYEEIQNYKKYNGVFTYNDLITQLYFTLTKNENFKKRLQNTYQIGIIDEFQDTDPYQWEIFKAIFLEEKKNQLVVVGDPKQAIYGFRGADIYTYFNAKEYYQQQRYLILSLNKSYRSKKTFIEDLNNLMEGVFQKIKEIIEKINLKYSKVEASDKKQNEGKCKIQYGIKFIKVKAENVYLARKTYGEKIVQIVKYLNKKCNYKYSDIAILYRGEEDIKPIKEVLLKNEIPFKNYAQDNVFQTLEANAIEFLLEFLAYPEDLKARKRFLIYYFIDIPYAKIEQLDNQYSFIQEKIGNWSKLLEERNWLKLFYTILEDTKFLYRYFALPDFERKIANWEHIIEILVEIATKKQLGVLELYKEFINLKLNSDEEYSLRLESDEDKIHLMTIHKSKGLEFPVVFISGWYNTDEPSVGDNDNFKFYDFNQSLWNICFFYEQRGNEVQIRNEHKFEELRLFYVAITRAKDLAFCIYPKLKDKNSKILETFISEEKNKFFFDPNKEIEEIQIQSQNLLEEENKNINNNINDIYKKILQYSKIEYNKKRYKLHSYSSFIRKETSAEVEEMDFDQVILEEEIPKVEPKTDFDKYLSYGTKTGIFIHKVFEIVSFEDFSNYDSKKEFIKNKYKKIIEYHRKLNSITISENELNSFYDFLFDYINEILNISIDGFCLKDIDPKKTKKEIGFLIQNIKTNGVITQMIQQNSFITGNLDLFFEHNNKFYLLDYKTTILMDYDLNTLKEYTEKHYKVQYLLYSYALYLWLNNIRKIKLEQKMPGGIIYFYLRGYKDQNSKVVYFQEFLTFKDIEKELINILK